jgi:hypothetical protein
MELSMASKAYTYFEDGLISQFALLLTNGLRKCGTYI